MCICAQILLTVSAVGYFLLATLFVMVVSFILSSPGTDPKIAELLKKISKAEQGIREREREIRRT